MGFITLLMAIPHKTAIIYFTQNIETHHMNCSICQLSIFIQYAQYSQMNTSIKYIFYQQYNQITTITIAPIKDRYIQLINYIMEYNTKILGQCKLNESQMIDYIKLYGEEIFGQTKQDSEISFNISSSQDGSANKTMIISADQTKQLMKNTVRRSKSKKQYSIRWNSSSKNNIQDTARTIVKPKYRNIVTDQTKTLEKQMQTMQNERLKIALEKQKLKQQNSKNKTYIEVTSRYSSIKPIMQGSYADYINKNIYSRMITESDYHINQKYKSRSKQQREQSWNRFLQKQKQWLKNKNMNIRNKELEKLSIEKKQLSHTFNIVEPQPPTIQQSIKRLKRKAQNLKQKLMSNSFKPILYTDRRDLHKFDKIIKKSKSKSRSKSKQTYRPTKSKSKQKLSEITKLDLKKNYETLIAIKNQNQLAFLARR